MVRCGLGVSIAASWFADPSNQTIVITAPMTNSPSKCPADTQRQAQPALASVQRQWRECLSCGPRAGGAVE
jgi:hypothetical protein